MTLVRHPWDAYGRPAPLDPPDGSPWACDDHRPRHEDQVACAAAYRDEATEHAARADRLEDEAWEAREAAAECRRLAEGLDPPPPLLPGHLGFEP